MGNALSKKVGPDIHPAFIFSAYVGGAERMPNIIEFVTSPDYLNRPNLYPRQATILKLITGSADLFTDYDWKVLDDWADDYSRTKNHGISPDYRERLDFMKEEERPWFREVIAVIGRRGGKGYIGGVMSAYVMWKYITVEGGDPQDHYGIDRDKKLTAFVFAGKRQQAKEQQWADIVNVILGAPCFERYIGTSLNESLTVYSQSDLKRIHELEERGVSTAMDMATFQIVPKESTAMAGRGPASFLQLYDEMAHVVAAGANRSAAEVYQASTPALDQFGKDAFIYAGSSPWEMTGQFYENYQRSVARYEDNPEDYPGQRGPMYPEMLMLQLTSWDTYEDWQIASDLEMWKGGPKFKPLKRAIQSYDAAMQRLERANPDTFAVERRSHFATVQDVYLPTPNVERIFQPWNGKVLEMQDRGVLSVAYKAHADPSKSNARFGFAIAHTEPDPDNPSIKHVVFDVIHAWEPANFPDHQIDYEIVEEELWGYAERFMPYEMTFDQFNSASVISRFTRRLREKRLPKQVSVYERTATAPVNWKRFEVFKTAIGMGWVHAPYHDIADLELRFLQERRPGNVDHPQSGPVQTKDVADCLVECVYSLIGEQVGETVESLSGLNLGMSAQGGFPTRRDEEVTSQLSGFGRSLRGGGSGPHRGGRR